MDQTSEKASWSERLLLCWLSGAANVHTPPSLPPDLHLYCSVFKYGALALIHAAPPTPPSPPHHLHPDLSPSFTLSPPLLLLSLSLCSLSFSSSKALFTSVARAIAMVTSLGPQTECLGPARRERKWDGEEE